MGGSLRLALAVIFLLNLRLLAFGADADAAAAITKVNSDSTLKGSDRGGLGDVLTITVAPWDKAWDASKWILYLDGIPIEGIYPDNRDFQKKGELRFTLRRNDKNKAHWAVLFDEAYEPNRWTRPVTVAVGTETAVNSKIKEYPLSSESDPAFIPFQLVAISGYRLAGAVLLPLVLLLLLLLCYWNTDLLRDTSYATPVAGKRPFSLGKVQMAFWTVLVFGGYLYVGLVTWDYFHSMSTSALVLLGISSATGLGAVLVDSNKQFAAKELNAAKDSLITAASAPADPNEKLRIQAKLAEVNTALSTAPSETATSHGPIQDLLYDAGVPSLHRIQLVLWTLTLGTIFVYSVLRDVEMPTFDTALLTLMGISSGTYLGFKFPEKKS